MTLDFSSSCADVDTAPGFRSASSPSASDSVTAWF
eukprot:CAMPEP_0185589052 /NCGR_PEP_ID=MMETSP0434-20130131/55467_1 /TAXON_ID=626734 ORGANISM="Favella taraikaensis, Strain Fe Narragansett Bay" /NCGR_SAMPLE_ID=MMETSP0434 /ASSEMBLY_ACC=CAM_ASM_000379 /LENGTH=34 /DNA_ID= /DNA_START= /DNA_END= /DNA_ORIENTATION=